MTNLIKVDHISQDKFEKITGRYKNTVKNYVGWKGGNDQAFKSGWTGYSREVLDKLEVGGVYLTPASYIQGEISVLPSVLFVGENPEGFRIGYESDITAEFYKKHTSRINS